MKNQGKRDSQIEFSGKMVNIGYFGTLALILVFVIYEWLK